MGGDQPNGGALAHIFHELVSAEELLDGAVGVANLTPADCLEHSASTERVTQATALRDIAQLAGPLEAEGLALGRAPP